jgi:mRNA-degrading endonuclease YafQ of YafQ-DinJ toxin-antitoxin module
MDKRQKILAATVVVVLVGFILDGFVITPWSEAMAVAEKDVQRLKSDARSSRAKVEMELEVSKEWKALKDRLVAVKSEDASNQLASLVETLIRKHDLKKSALSPEPPVPLAGSAAFRDHLLTLTFQGSWDAFVKLLIDLYTADEFVRIQRIGVQSHYLTEKESFLDVTLRLSTVSPLPTGNWK